MRNPRKITADKSKCTGCRRCQLACSQRRTGEYNYSKANIDVEEDDYSVTLIKFTDDCDLCGLCIRYCEYGALKRE
jgi:ferredoxin